MNIIGTELFMQIFNRINKINAKYFITFAFISYSLSTIFIVFCSVSAVKIWPSPWNRLTILTACIIPFAFVLLWKFQQRFYHREIKKELLFIPIIFVLGTFNIFLSENREITLKVMTLFLISGILAFFMASCIFSNKNRIRFFLHLCWGCLFLFCIYGIGEYLFKRNVVDEPIKLLSHNSIPAGSLLVLLLVAPMLLYNNNKFPTLKMITIIFTIGLVVLIGKRGPLLGLIGMLLFWGTILYSRKLWIIILILILFIGTGYKMRNYLPTTLSKSIIKENSTLFRLEHYLFAFHVFSQNAWFGVGLHAPLDKYLVDYHVHFAKNNEYSYEVKKYKSFDNMMLCGFVSMGSLFTITYIILVIYLIKSMFGHIKKDPARRFKAVMFLTPLFGFFIHSMTFDSLLYPHLNWLFHSYLGLMANFDKM